MSEIGKLEKAVMSALHKGKSLLDNKRKSRERRKRPVFIDKKNISCRYLKKKPQDEKMGYCRFFKRAILIPGTCLRCSAYIAVDDRRSGKDRRV